MAHFSKLVVSLASEKIEILSPLIFEMLYGGS